jgi:haloalkane dehalogenase
MATIDAFGSPMYYEDSGTGTPFVFLHGNPTSSHLWRNVLTTVSAEARCLAPDLIGMGRSGQPAIGYTFADQSRYLDAWFGAVGLDRVVLIGHDWGGVLAFDWAARHPGQVRGLAFLETIVKPMTWPDYPAAARERFRAFRTPGDGERLVLQENVFITQALHSTVLTPLSPADLAEYARPYPTPESRRPLLEWPRAIPLEGEPADVVARVRAYDRWLAASTEVPKLLLTFDGSPTLTIGPRETAWCEANVAGLETEYCGPAGHLAPEDQPGAITAAITGWAARHGLTKS